jgi:hypothetical protein
MCLKVGNRIGNQYYESCLPVNFRKPVHSDGISTVENFIRAKYQRREFVPKEKPSPCELVSKGMVPQHETPRNMESMNLVDEGPSSPGHPELTSGVSAGGKPGVDSVDLLGGFSPVKSTSSTQGTNFVGSVNNSFHFVPTFVAPQAHQQPRSLQNSLPVLQPQNQGFDMLSFPSSLNSPQAPVVPVQPAITKSNAFSGLADLDAFAMFGESHRK